MQRTARRAAALTTATAALVLAGPAQAFAASTYQPGTPSPTVSGISASAGSTSPSAANAGLAYTGADVAPWAAGGIALLVAGGVLVGVTRRRGSRA